MKTTMSALDLAYNRVDGVLPGVSLQNHGRPQTYGDLTWLRLDRLMEQSKVATIRPLFEGSAHPEATAPKLQEPVWVGTAQRTGLGSCNARAGPLVKYSVHCIFLYLGNNNTVLYNIWTLKKSPL